MSPYTGTAVMFMLLTCRSMTATNSERFSWQVQWRISVEVSVKCPTKLGLGVTVLKKKFDRFLFDRQLWSVSLNRVSAKPFESCLNYGKFWLKYRLEWMFLFDSFYQKLNRKGFSTWLPIQWNDGRCYGNIERHMLFLLEKIYFVYVGSI